MNHRILPMILMLGVVQGGAFANDPPSAKPVFLARLIWATNDKASPNPRHKAIETQLTKSLKERFRWNNFFEVSRTNITLTGQVGRIPLSRDCEIEMKEVGPSTFEVKLYGRGKLVTKTTEAISKGKRIVLAGESENQTAWFVALRIANKQPAKVNGSP